MWILWKMRLWIGRYVNFVKNETLKMWISWKMRFPKCEFCEKCHFVNVNLVKNVNFWIKWGFLPSVEHKIQKIKCNLLTGIPTHVYQFGASILAAGPAILLAQLTALFIVLPVFGKNGHQQYPEASSSQELMLVAQSSSKQQHRQHLTIMSYISRRFSSNSIKVLVTTLVVTLWTLLAVSTMNLI